MSPRTSAVLKELEKKGFTASQAEGIVERVMEAIENSNFVTIADMKVEMAHLETKLIGKIESTKNQMIMWLIGAQIAALGFLKLI